MSAVEALEAEVRRVREQTEGMALRLLRMHAMLEAADAFAASCQPGRSIEDMFDARDAYLALRRAVRP